MRASRLFARLFLGHALLVSCTLGLLGIIELQSLDRSMAALLERRLRVDAQLVAAALQQPLERGEPEVLRERVRALARATGLQIALVAADRSVLADGQSGEHAAAALAERPELSEALRSGQIAFARHRSDPDGRERIGLAMPLASMGGIQLCIADLAEELPRPVPAFLLALGIALLLAAGYAGFLARRIAEPIAELTRAANELAAGVPAPRATLPHDEVFGGLAATFAAMSGQLRTRLEMLSTDRNKLLAVLGGMVEGVVAIDRDERILHMNEVATRLLGAAAPSAGAPLATVTRLAEVHAALAETVKGGREYAGQMIRPDTSDDRVIEMRAAPLRDHRNDVVGAVLVLHDVTQLRRLEAVRRDFVANVSHELKTPLTAIRGLIETVLDDPAMPEATKRRFLDKVREQSERLSHLVSDLLVLSRVESRDGTPEPVRLDLRGIVHESHAGLVASAQEQRIALELELPPGAVWMVGDPEGLRQVVDNLLDNAIKYTPAGGRVTVRLRTNQDQAVLEVIDTGIGIEPRDQDRIFERFYRVDKARSRELGGTGLGLSIVKNIALRHGGEVAVESLPGSGSTFRVLLPILAAPESTEHERP